MMRFNDEITPRVMTTLAVSRDRRQIVRASAIAAGALVLGRAATIAAPIDQAEEPSEDPWENGDCEDVEPTATPEDEQESDDAPDGTPTAETVIPPVRILVPSIKVDAKVEVLEVVADALQDPSNGDDVAWYKETGKPGQEGNSVFAGHLNWYGQPEAVFFAIDQLKEGDEIIVRDHGCGEFTYLVEWAELIQVADADMKEITGPSDEKMITLITCGGTWDPSISEYLERTVVRGRLKGSETAGDEDEPSGDDDLGDPVNPTATPESESDIGEPIIEPRDG
jgi:LPXTG-site transpeptidase (sortase) family protein